jgi:hypothetical protein
MNRIRTIAPLVAAAAALALPASAAADYHKVIEDCSSDGKLDHHYSRKDLKQAKKKMPTDIREYTDCRDLINAAMANGGGGSSTGAGSGGGGGIKTESGATAGSAADVAALKGETARTRRAKPRVSAGGQTIRPAASGLSHIAGAANRLPTPVIVALAAVAALCLAGGLVAARRRWPDVARAALRVVRR